MISAAELRALRAEWQLRDDVIEKDYALGWMLAAIAEDADLGSSWIFKGGTCLRKCYYETYRFSEDLDFTVIEGGLKTPMNWLASSSGLANGSVSRQDSRSPSTTARSDAGGTCAATQRPRDVSPSAAQRATDLAEDQARPHER